jgi:predicted Rossmann fold nucleotide-binding protein DprA/Smf involved in DNA uptake
VADLLDRIQREIAARLRELRPFVAEAERLQDALDSLSGAPAGDGGIIARVSAGTSRRRPRARSAATGGAPRGQNRALIEQVLIDRNGATAAEVAQETGIAIGAVRTALSALVREGRLAKAPGGRPTVYVPGF